MRAASSPDRDDSASITTVIGSRGDGRDGVEGGPLDTQDETDADGTDGSDADGTDADGTDADGTDA